MDYITEQDMLDNGVDTTNATDGLLAITLANQWLNTHKLPKYTNPKLIPIAIKLAGVKIAKAFLDGTIFTGRDEALVTQKTVKAGSVESSKTFSSAASDQPISQDEVIALQLIAPFITKGGFRQVRISR